MKVKRSQNRLYKLIIETTNYAYLLSKVEDPTWLWHSHLGHVNFQAMYLLSKNRMVRGIPKFTQPEDVCQGCLMTKRMQNLFLDKANYSATKVFESVHEDQSGPISP